MPASHLPFAVLSPLVITIAWLLIRTRKQRQHARDLHEKLPADLNAWRNSDEDSPPKELWSNLRTPLSGLGYSLWPERANCPGYFDATAWRVPRFNPGWNYVASVANHASLPAHGLKTRITTGLARPARSAKGSDVMLRITSVKGLEWMSEERRILRILGTGVRACHRNNHTLPLIDEVNFGDIVFAVFPYIPCTVEEVLGHFTTTSAGDYVDIALQMLEATAYIHKLNIAHQDLFQDNFLIEYYPESRVHRGAVRPKVFLIDFETAVSFPEGCCPEERRVTSHFFPNFARRPPPELVRNREDGTPYDPFPLDIWQLAHGLLGYQTPIPDIGKYISEKMYHADPVSRPTAQEAFDFIFSAVRKIPPVDLDQPLTDSYPSQE